MDNPTIIAAIISAVVAFFVLLVNYGMNKRSQKVQREIAKQNIDANIISKSRIEWVQEVRKATSKLISAYSELAKTQPNDSIDYINKVVDFQEKNEILILFFGNDSLGDNNIDYLKEVIYFDKETSGFIVEEEIKQKLFEKNSNKNKNDVIVFYLRSLKNYFDYFNKYYLSNLKHKKTWEKQMEFYLHESLDSIIKDSATDIKSFDINGNEYMSTYYAHDEKKEKEAYKNYLIYENKLKFFDIPINIINHLDFLSEIMRLYLKIEWNKAKINE